LLYGPTTATSGTTITFSATVGNTYSETIGIYSVFVHFDWQASNVGYYLFQSSNPVSIAVGSSRTFSDSVSVPTGIPTDTSHVLQVLVEGTTPGVLGGWSVLDRGTITYSGNIYVHPASTGGLGGTGDLGYLAAGLLVVVVVVIVIVLAIASQRRPTMPQMVVQPTQPQWTPSFRAPPVCPRCGAIVSGAFCQTCGQRL
jgi:hypothetical protein